MAPNKPVSMRARRRITYLVVGAITVTVLGFLGLPRLISDEMGKLPETVQKIANQVQPKPSTIFEPPKHSLDDANSLWVVVNKQRQITPLRYKPENLVFPDFPKPNTQNPFGLQLRLDAATATVDMAQAMKEEGAGTLVLNSGFRTYKNQQGLYNRTRDTRGLDVAEKLSARPGHSEHQLGLAADFSARGQGCVVMVCFGTTKAGKWLEQNAPDYGFVLRYPKGFKKVTGFQYEPWHFRYVGFELAQEMKTRGIRTLEDFWKLPAAPDYAEPAG